MECQSSPPGRHELHVRTLSVTASYLLILQPHAGKSMQI